MLWLVCIIVITHLLCANDTLVYSEADRIPLEFLGKVLTWFPMVSRLKINLRKCEIVPIGPTDNIAMFAQVVQGKDPPYYLGYLYI